jgi:hypothetical protein
VDVAAGAGVHLVRVDAAREPRRRGCGAGVAPAEHARQRPAVLGDREQRMPEARGARDVPPGADGLQHPLDARDERVRVVLAHILLLAQLVDALGALVEDLRARRRRPDIEGQHAGHRSLP